MMCTNVFFSLSLIEPNREGMMLVRSIYYSWKLFVSTISQVVVVVKPRGIGGIVRGLNIRTSWKLSLKRESIVLVCVFSEFYLVIVRTNENYRKTYIFCRVSFRMCSRADVEFQSSTFFLYIRNLPKSQPLFLSLRSILFFVHMCTNEKRL